MPTYYAYIVLELEAESEMMAAEEAWELAHTAFGAAADVQKILED